MVNVHFRIFSLFAVVLCIASGCSTVEIRANLVYESVAAPGGATGEILLARAVERHNALKLPGGKVLLGTVKNSGTEIVTADSAVDWVGLAMTKELTNAGFRVTSVPELPRGAPRGVNVAILGVGVEQEDNFVMLTTTATVRVEVEVWRDGANVRTFSAESEAQEIGIDRSSKPITGALMRALQGAIRKLVPDLVKLLDTRPG